MPIKLIAAVLFILIYALIMQGKIHRTIIAIWGALLFTAFPLFTPEGFKMGFLSQSELLRYENWEALGLIAGMFTLVAALRESGFFRWLGLHMLKFTKFNLLKIFIIFALSSAVLSALMDSITVLMFMATLALETCSFLGINPLPLLILSITSANIGGAATMVGDPPNIIIGTSYHFSFMDFVLNTAPIAVVVLIVNILFFVIFYRRLIKTGVERAAKLFAENKIEPKNAITDLRIMGVGLSVFAVVIVLLATHHMLNLSVAFIGILGASLVLLLGGDKMPEILERIDWHTLIFFGCLFIMIGGLEKVGVFTDVANWIGSAFGNNLTLSIMAILWISAILSAVVDNVPFAAAMVPVVKNLAVLHGLPLATMSWALALGTDIGGNATPIGASANIVGLGIAEKRAGKKIGWFDYCKVAVPSMLISVAISSVLIYVRYLM